MIFAIVWGSLVFIGQNAFRGHKNNDNTTSGLVTTVPANTSGPGLSHIVLQSPVDP